MNICINNSIFIACASRKKECVSSTLKTADDTLVGLTVLTDLGKPEESLVSSSSTRTSNTEFRLLSASTSSDGWMATHVLEYTCHSIAKRPGMFKKITDDPAFTGCKYGRHDSWSYKAQRAWSSPSGMVCPTDSLGPPVTWKENLQGNQSGKPQRQPPSDRKATS